MYLIISHYIVEPVKVDPHRKAHMEWVTKYIASGVFVTAGPRDTKNGGVIVAKGVDKIALTKILEEDSFVTEKFVENQIVGFDPFYVSDEFSTLKGG